MEQHPIPRQITTFEFKLIGFMTLRQFLYLVVAFPVAYIVYALFPIPLVNILLAVMVAAAGLVTAFVPYQERTLDVWAKNLWKRLQNPTQYYYKKHNDPLYFLKDLYFLADPHHMLAHIESRDKLAQYLAMTKQRPRPNYQKKQIGALLQAPTNTLQTSTAPIVPTDAAHAPSPAMQSAMNVTGAPAIPPMPQVPANQVPVPSVQVNGSAPAAAPVITPPPVVPQRPAGPQTPLHPVMKTPAAQVVQPVVPQPALMQTEVVQPKPIPMPQVIPPAPVLQSQAQQAPIQAQIISPSGTPPPPGQSGNQPFFSGIVRTSKRIPIPGILVYIKDDKGSPLRLMKSNPHGVFATFNPLSPGDYTFEIKDPTGTYFFDTMKVPVKETNSIPAEFMSKEIL